MDISDSPKIDQKTRPDPEVAIRAILARILRDCPKERAVIAEDLSALTGRRVTESMLNDLCAISKKSLRVPLSWARAIGEVTGNDDLAFVAMRDSLRQRAELGARAAELYSLLERMASQARSLAEPKRRTRSGKAQKRSGGG